MIYLERKKTILSLAVMLKDDLSSDKNTIGEVFLEAEGIRENIIKHSTGYFLLLNLPEGKYTITGGGTFYNMGTLSVDTKSINATKPFVDLSLSPNSSYPFPEGKSVLKGGIMDTENNPISGASIKVANMTPSAISEDNGGYFIQFPVLDANKTVTLNIKKDGYKSVKQSAPLKKGATTRADTTILTKL